jgi:hypothetical protein
MFSLQFACAAAYCARITFTLHLARTGLRCKSAWDVNVTGCHKGGSRSCNDTLVSPLCGCSSAELTRSTATTTSATVTIGNTATINRPLTTAAVVKKVGVRPAGRIVIMGDSLGAYSKDLLHTACRESVVVNAAVGGTTAIQWSEMSTVKEAFGRWILFSCDVCDQS